MHYTAKFWNNPPPCRSSSICSRKSPAVPAHPVWSEPRVPQVGVLRHTVEQVAGVSPFVQILDAPVPQMGNQLLEVFRL